MADVDVDIDADVYALSVFLFDCHYSIQHSIRKIQIGYKGNM